MAFILIGDCIFFLHLLMLFYIWHLKKRDKTIHTQWMHPLIIDQKPFHEEVKA